MAREISLTNMGNCCGISMAVKTKPKAAPPKKPRNRKKTQRGEGALLRPTKTPKPRKTPKRWTSTTSAHNRPEPRPETKPNRQTDRPTQTDRTQYRTRAGSRHQTAPRNSHVCVGPFFSRNLQPPSSGLWHVHLGRAGNQRPQAHGRWR